MAGVRWAAIVALCGYSFFRRSLTPWIFAGMLVGAEIGYDLSFAGDATRIRVAGDLQVLSSIFLRLIKTIIAPLIFSTLVVGIAGHSNLKQVGRMGIKALVYFEIVTTLALFIGLAAIHLSQGRRGTHGPAQCRHGHGFRRCRPKNGLMLSCTSFLKILPSLWLKARCCRLWCSALFLALRWP